MDELISKRRKLNNQDLIQDLELLFTIVQLKIDSKTKLINNNHDEDVSKLNSLDKKEAHENGFNEIRFNLIVELNENMVSQMNNLSSFFTELVNSNRSDYNRKIRDLNSKFDEIKSNYAYFKKTSYLNLNHSLYRYFFTQPLNLSKLNTYSQFLNLQKEYKLINLNQKFKWPKKYFKDIDNINFITLPNNKLLAGVVDEENMDNYMIIIDKQGTIINSKRFNIKPENPSAYLIRISSSKIILSIRENEAGPFSVEIYDFNFVLVQTYKLVPEYFQAFTINAHEEMFCKNFNNDKKYLFYDLNTFRSKHIDFQDTNGDEPFYIYGIADELVYFDKRKLFLARSNKRYERDMIYILDRFNGSKLKEIKIAPRRFFSTIKFDNSSKIYDFDTRCGGIIKLRVFDSEGEFLYSARLNMKFESLNFNMYNTICFNIKKSNELIKYDEY